MTTDDHRPTSGRYGNPPRPLARDDFAGVLNTLMPVDDSGSALPLAVPVPGDALAAAQHHCRQLAAAYPSERLARLAARVANLLEYAASPEAAGEQLLYAAALLCHEEAARTGMVADLNPGSAQLTYLHLEVAASEATRTTVQQALAEQH